MSIMNKKSILPVSNDRDAHGRCWRQPLKCLHDFPTLLPLAAGTGCTRLSHLAVHRHVIREKTFPADWRGRHISPARRVFRPRTPPFLASVALAAEPS